MGRSMLLQHAIFSNLGRQNIECKNKHQTISIKTQLWDVATTIQNANVIAMGNIYPSQRKFRGKRLLREHYVYIHDFSCPNSFPCIIVNFIFQILHPVKASITEYIWFSSNWPLKLCVYSVLCLNYFICKNLHLVLVLTMLCETDGGKCQHKIFLYSPTWDPTVIAVQGGLHRLSGVIINHHGTVSHSLYAI